MPSQTWGLATSGNVFSENGTTVVGTGNGAGIITINAAANVTFGSAASNTLTIQAGVTVKFGAGSRITLAAGASFFGTLKCQGTLAAPVVLTSVAAVPVAGDWVGVECTGGTATNLQQIEMDYTTIEYSATAIASQSGGGFTLGVKVTCNDCTFRHQSAAFLSHQAGQSGTAPWNITRCIFYNCAADSAAAFSVVLSDTGGAGTPTEAQKAKVFLYNCTMWFEENQGNNITLMNIGSRGRIHAEDCIFYAFNTGGGIARLAAFNILDAVMTNNHNFYFVESVQDYVAAVTDQNVDPMFLSTLSCVTPNLKPNAMAGDPDLYVAASDGSWVGALEPYGIPVPPTPPVDDGECSSDYAGFTSLSCIPFVCNYDFFTGEYPEEWRLELYERKEMSPHSLVVCLQIPNRGIPIDFEFAPGVPIPVVGTDAESITVDIGCWIQSMRPIRAERDVTFREYQGSDIDLVVMDWFGRLDPALNPSLFFNVRWPGVRVEIGSWIHGTNQVLRHGRFFLQDIKRRDESTVLTVRDWFLETLAQPLRGNSAGENLAVKSENTTVAFDPSYITVDPNLGTIETVRLIFQDEGSETSSTFLYVGSVTGEQGIGNISFPDFTTNDGAVTIPSVISWPGANLVTGKWAPKDEVTFTISNVATGNPVEVVYDYLTAYGNLVEGIDVVSAEFFEAEQLLPTMAKVKLRHDKPVTLLEACRIAAQHGFLTLSTNALGHVVLGGFKPTLELSLSQIQDVAICGSNDLKTLETENLPIYNVIRASYSPMAADEITHTGLVTGTPNRSLSYPTDDLGTDFNRSAIFYENEYVLQVELPGFRAGQEGALFAILQNYWIFFEGTPTAREKLIATTKLHNLNRDLEDIVRLESSRPNRQVWAQVIGFGKAPLSQEIELTMVDISDIVQPDFSCGYAFCDSGHYTDDCWVCW